MIIFCLKKMLKIFKKIYTFFLSEFNNHKKIYEYEKIVILIFFELV